MHSLGISNRTIGRPPPTLCKCLNDVTGWFCAALTSMRRSSSARGRLCPRQFPNPRADSRNPLNVGAQTTQRSRESESVLVREFISSCSSKLVMPHSRPDHFAAGDKFSPMRVAVSPQTGTELILYVRRVYIILLVATSCSFLMRPCQNCEYSCWDGEFSKAGPE